MPNPKTGTVTMDVGKKAVSDVKGGKIDFKVDKTGIVHASIGKVSFEADKILETPMSSFKHWSNSSLQAQKESYIKSIILVEYYESRHPC